MLEKKDPTLVGPGLCSLLLGSLLRIPGPREVEGDDKMDERSYCKDEAEQESDERDRIQMSRGLRSLAGHVKQEVLVGVVERGQNLLQEEHIDGCDQELEGHRESVQT